MPVPRRVEKPKTRKDSHKSKAPNLRIRARETKRPPRTRPRSKRQGNLRKYQTQRRPVAAKTVRCACALASNETQDQLPLAESELGCRLMVVASISAEPGAASG